MLEGGKISILMNCFNGERHLESSLRSVLKQDYSNWELIFWDNRSTDSSRQIFKKFKDSRLKYFEAPSFTDLGGGREAAWDKLTGDFIAILDTDDCWRRDKLSAQIEFMQNNPDIGVCFSNTIFFSKFHKEALFKSPPPLAGGVQALILKYYVPLVSVMFRTETLKAHKLSFDGRFSHICDFDLVVRAANKSNIGYLPDTLASWRVHPNSGSVVENYKFNLELLNWCDVTSKETAFQEYSKTISKLRSRTILRGLADSLSDKERMHRYLFELKHRSVSFWIFAMAYVPLYFIFSHLKRRRYREKWWQNEA